MDVKLTSIALGCDVFRKESCTDTCSAIKVICILQFVHGHISSKLLVGDVKITLVKKYTEQPAVLANVLCQHVFFSITLLYASPVNRTYYLTGVPSYSIMTNTGYTSKRVTSDGYAEPCYVTSSHLMVSAYYYI